MKRLLFRRLFKRSRNEYAVYHFLNHFIQFGFWFETVCYFLSLLIFALKLSSSSSFSSSPSFCGFFKHFYCFHRILFHFVRKQSNWILMNRFCMVKQTTHTHNLGLKHENKQWDISIRRPRNRNRESKKKNKIKTNPS